MNHFVEAQEHTYNQALSEIRSGLKRTHWMWFVFPQLAGLGSSATAVGFSIGTADEARAYLNHPILGPRLIECSVAVLSVQSKSATQIFGTPDDLKLRSSATLFAHLSPPNSVFHQILERYHGGEPDLRTLRLLTPTPE